MNSTHLASNARRTPLVLGMVVFLAGCGAPWGTRNAPSCNPLHKQSVDRAKWSLAATAESPYPGAVATARASAVFRKRGTTCSSGGWNRKRVRLKVRLKGFPKNQAVELVSSPAFEVPLILTTNRHGRARWKGTGLPNGVDNGTKFFIDVRLATRADTSLPASVEDGVTILAGSSRVIAPARGGRVSLEDPVSGLALALQIDERGGGERERTVLTVTGLRPGASLRLLAGDGGSPSAKRLIPVASRFADGSGSVELRFDSASARGPRLPFGARRVQDLRGVRMGLEVDGDVVDLGPVPEWLSAEGLEDFGY